MAEHEPSTEGRDGWTAAEHPIAIGSQVGPYRIVGELGGGGMGLVYRAAHARLDRPTAIKVLRPELGRRLWALDRFLTEARAAAAVRHPGVVEIYDYGIMASGRPFIAMELLEGVTLGRRLAARGRLLPADAARIARQIASALAAAHARGIVHRDIKPDNAFLVRDPRTGALDRVKLLDFGIARREGALLRSPAAEMILGTPAYMSPEQCRGGDDDHRTDLYSLGCILFEMLSGQPPYGRGPTEVLFAAHSCAPVPDLAEHAEVPQEAARLVTRLLAKHPEARPRSALDVIAGIDRWLASSPPTTPARRSSVRTAVGAASGIGSWFAALGLWHRWRSYASADDEWGESHDAVDAGDQPRLAKGTAPRSALNNAPTEPLRFAVEAGPDAAGLRQFSPTRLVRRHTEVDGAADGQVPR